MADEKISELTDGTAPQNSDQFAVARSGANVKLSWLELTGATDSLYDAAGSATAAQAAAEAASQPLDADLTSIAALDSSTSGAIASDGAGWIKKTYSQLKTALSLVASDVGLGSVTNDAQVKLSTVTAKGDLYVATASATVARLGVGSDTQVLTADSSQTSGVKWAAAASGGGVGSSSLVFRYTVTGSDKASIDTGVDTPDAGSNDWTNGDLLEVFIYARTDEAVAASNIAVTLNNDTGNNYDHERINVANTTVSGGPSNARANWQGAVAGASDTANVFGTIRIAVPNFAGTVGFKAGELTCGNPDETAANTAVQLYAVSYRSTSAITRLAIAPLTAGKKLKVGSQILIYKRSSS